MTNYLPQNFPFICHKSATSVMVKHKVFEAYQITPKINVGRVMLSITQLEVF